jgi:L-iditol 2-dehydrogenase
MKQIVLEKQTQFGIRESEIPAPGPGQALVRLLKTGVCGSDIHLYKTGRIGDIKISEPLVIGHECMGVVEDIGPGVRPELKGRRVAVDPSMNCMRCEICLSGNYHICPYNKFLGLPPIDGGLQEYIVHPEELLEPLPDSVSDDAAVVLEPMAIALHAINLVKVKPGQRVVILGTGVLGTCVLELLSLYRGLRVVCVDLLEDRLARAKEMGADVVIQAQEGGREEVRAKVLEAIGGFGAHIVFECSGSADTMWNTCEVSAPTGHVSIIGTNPGDELVFPSASTRRRGLTLRFVRRSLNTLPACIELTDRGAIQPEKLVTHTFPMDKTAEAFQTVDEYREGVLKALIDLKS